MNLESFIRGIFGLALLIGIAFLISNNKKKINWRLVVSGFLLQIIFAILILRGDSLRSFFTPLGWPKDFFNSVSFVFVLILNFTTEGAKFVFGNLALAPGNEGNFGFFFAEPRLKMPMQSYTFFLWKTVYSAIRWRLLGLAI